MSEPTGRPFDYLTDRSLFDTIKRVLQNPNPVAAEYRTALIDECHTRALVLHDRAMAVTYQCLECGQDVAILDQPTHDDAHIGSSLEDTDEAEARWSDDNPETVAEQVELCGQILRDGDCGREEDHDGFCRPVIKVLDQPTHEDTAHADDLV
ncbi:MAG: hypothetical protein JWQ81_8492 [Amycolatopsis sp.]|uniref:hypothetical protein n=1 Tax=Amycolatopsis sp. TaxID=37632 RepID=UPI002609E7E0|nr:hypothetical protein [Amycolatopsis sp.]MCU1687753.1 hypothetical protein [Amycolatopsis sp.]